MHFYSGCQPEVKTNRLSDVYYTAESYLFPMEEEEIGEITSKMKESLRISEVEHLSSFLTNALRWCGLGRPMQDREKLVWHSSIDSTAVSSREKSDQKNLFRSKLRKNAVVKS